MRNINKYFVSLVFTAVLAASAYAQDAGRTALPFLKMDMGARYYGMAGAATAYADDVTGMTFYNPAALGMVESFQLAGTVSEAQLDMKYHYGGLGFSPGGLWIFGQKSFKNAVFLSLITQLSCRHHSVVVDLVVGAVVQKKKKSNEW